MLAVNALATSEKNLDFTSSQILINSFFIVEIQYHIERDEKTVEDVKEHNGVSRAIDYLVNDAENVAQYYEPHKHWTFTGHYLGAQRLGNRHRPRNRKTQQEQDFPDACKIQIHI